MAWTTSLAQEIKIFVTDKFSPMKQCATLGTPCECISRLKEADAVLDGAMSTSYGSGVEMLLHLSCHSRVALGNPVRELTKVDVSHRDTTTEKEMLRIMKFVLHPEDPVP